MHSAQLRDAVVSIFDEDSFVQLLGAGDANGCVNGFVTSQIEILDEFVEEESPQTLGGTAVTGKQRALHNLGKVHQSEDRQIEIGEVPPQNVRFLRRERLRNVHRHAAILRNGPVPDRDCQRTPSGTWPLPNWRFTASRSAVSSHMSMTVIAMIFAPSMTARSAVGDAV